MLPARLLGESELRGLGEHVGPRALPSPRKALPSAVDETPVPLSVLPP